MNSPDYRMQQEQDEQQQYYFNQENEVPNINTMVSSKYLKTADIPDPVYVTCQGVKQVNMAKEGEAADYKWAIKFKEFEQPMILNSTNIHLAAKICGSEDTDNWKGKELILYTDPTVAFGGQIVGGLRLKGEEKAPVKVAAKTTVTPAGPRSVESVNSALNEAADDVNW